MAMLAILILPLVDPGLHRARRRCCRPALAGIANPGPHGFSRDPLRLHLGDRQQRLGLRRPHRQHALLQHDARPRDVDRPLPHDRPDAGDRRLARGQEDACRPRPAPSRPTAALFVGLLVGVILIVGGLTFFPALALGPIVEHLAMHRRHTCSEQDAVHDRPPAATAPRSTAGDPRCPRSATRSASSTRARWSATR